MPSFVVVERAALGWWVHTPDGCRRRWKPTERAARRAAQRVIRPRRAVRGPGPALRPGPDRERDRPGGDPGSRSGGA